MLLKDFALQMRTMWNEALKEAGESNSRIVSKNVDVLDMVRYDANNKPYVEIDEDILDGVAEEDYEQTAKNVLTELFKEGIDYKNNVFTMNKRDKNEFVRNRTMTYWLHNNKKLRMDKLRLSKNAMEIIKNADNWKNVEKKYNNTNNEKIVDFAYGYVNVSVFGNDYSAKVVTGVDKRGIIHLYDISDMMPTEIKRSANTTVHPKRGASIFNGASIDESINEDRKNVNKNILYSYAGEIEARDTSNRMNLPEKERREKIPEKGNENTVHRFFSLRQSVEETKDLIAVHNLSEKNLLENIKLGGFPMPSIAITKVNNSYDNFGDISVVFKKDTINPSMEENKVYSGDAWTPMFPRTEWKLNEKAMKKMADMFNTSTNYIEQYVKDPETAVEKLKAEPKVKEAFVENEKADIEKKTKMPDYETKIFSNEASRQFIEENNITVDDIMENDEIKRELANKVYPPKEGEKNLYKRMRENLIEKLNRYKLEDDYEIFKGNVEPIFDQTSYDEAVDEYVNKHSEQYTKYIEDALENVYEDKYLVKEDVEPLKANGERKSFNKLHMPYEINNIVTLMKKQKKGKGGGFFGGAGNLKGAATETFTSIDEIRRNKYKIQNISKDELRKKYNSLNSKIQEIDNYILGEENDGVEARLRKTENINETMVEAFALDKFTKSNVKKKFNDSNIEITDSVYEQMKELRDELKEIPVQYFEAKPERAVSTNEIAYVVVPNSVSEKTKEALRKNGIE